MKQFLLATALISLLIFVRCNNGNDNSKGGKETPIPGNATVAAVYTRPDSINELTVMLRIITDVKFDSVTRRNRIEWDTIFGYNQTIMDSTGKKPLLDSAGNKQFYWKRVSKDSVNWEICGVPLDTLLKKGRLKNQK